MGLDNGIVLVSKGYDFDPPHPRGSYFEGEVEVCYWRKFWGFRNEVIEFFNQEKECEDIPLDWEDVYEIILILERFLDRDYFNTYGQSIWYYEDYLVHMINDLENLRYLANYLKENPKIECYFYDSY